MSKTKKAEGVEFPYNETEQRRATMGINKRAFAKAMGAVNADKAKEIEDLPERKWRRAYQKNVVENVRESAKKPENAIAVAEAGLKYLHDTMVFVRPGIGDGDRGKDAKDAKPQGPELTLKEAMAKFTDAKFSTHEIQGSGPRVTDYTVQYKPFGKPGPLKDLQKNELRKQIDTWVKTGAIEKDCGVAMTRVVDNPDWCDLKDTYFVLFGAGSAMGPFYKLMDLGANVIALDLDVDKIWERLIKETRCRAGKLIFPVKETVKDGASDADIAKIAGCNLMADTPEIRTWLEKLYPDKQFVCMALAYLDGERFVKVSMAMDAIIASLVEKRGKDKMGVAYLCTPTDAHICTASSVVDAKAKFARAPMWQKMLAGALQFTAFGMKKNVEKPLLDDDGKEIDGLQVVDCIVPEQGPNYILAKRLQHWRAMVCRSKGVLASSNIAPSTATASVLSNPMFALSYNGMPSIKPMEITYQETSNSVMAALLIRDVRDPSAAANPSTKLANPLCLFGEDAWHGGCWRTGYKFSSIGPPAVVSYVSSSFFCDPYLLAYSLWQAIGWFQVLTVVLQTPVSKPCWSTAYPTLTFFQHLGFMEVLHAVLGLTKSDFFTTFIQIFSRVFVIALVQETKAGLKDQNDFFIRMMLFAWCCADFTRYVYYCFGALRSILTNVKGVLVALKVVKMGDVVRAADPVFNIPYILTWLRYSLFIVLYPIGVFGGELNCIRITYSDVLLPMEAAKFTTFSSWLFQTIKWIVGGSSWTYFIGVFISYAVGLPMLMMMLWAKRKKELGGNTAKVSKPVSGSKKSN